MFAIDDRRPAGRAHILVCPKRHIPNTRSLAGGEGAALVAHMRSVGRALLLERARGLTAAAPPAGARGCCGSLLPAWRWGGRGRRRRRGGGGGGGGGGGPLEGGLLEGEAPVQAAAARGGGSAPAGAAAEDAAPPRMLFGFHKPPWRSVDHLHMHALLLPLRPCVALKYTFPLNWVEAGALEAALLGGGGGGGGNSGGGGGGGSGGGV